MATPNTLFALLGVDDVPGMETRLAGLSPWPIQKIGDGQWLIVAPAATTTKEISDKLGITGSDSPVRGIVLRVENYFGRYASFIWEWITTKLGAELGNTTTV